MFCYFVLCIVGCLLVLIVLVGNFDLVVMMWPYCDFVVAFVLSGELLLSLLRGSDSPSIHICVDLWLLVVLVVRCRIQRRPDLCR